METSDFFKTHPMNRRKFLTGTVAAVSAAALLPLEAKEPAAQSGKTRSSNPDSPDAMEQHVADCTAAMLCMQRAPWEQGVAVIAMLISGQEANIVRLSHEAVLRQTKDGRLGVMGSTNTSTDPMVAGAGVMAAWRISGEERFKTAADKLYDYCKHTATRGANGAFYHFLNSKQMWSDSIFMAPLFLAAYGDFDDAMQQVKGYHEILWLEDKQMYGHKWDDSRQAFSRRDCWGSGNGWAASSMAILHEILPADRKADRDLTARYAREVIDGCLKHLRPDGLFHDVVDDPSTFVETNLPQMLAFTIYKGVHDGWLDRSYLVQAERMRNAARSKTDAFGIVHDACGSPSFNSPGTSTEAQAYAVMMEYMRLQLTRKKMI